VRNRLANHAEGATLAGHLRLRPQPSQRRDGVGSLR
jgi:hypothetical protein